MHDTNHTIEHYGRGQENPASSFTGISEYSSGIARIENARSGGAVDSVGKTGESSESGVRFGRFLVRQYSYLPLFAACGRQVEIPTRHKNAVALTVVAQDSKDTFSPPKDRAVCTCPLVCASCGLRYRNNNQCTSRFPDAAASVYRYRLFGLGGCRSKSFRAETACTVRMYRKFRRMFFLTNQLPCVQQIHLLCCSVFGTRLILSPKPPVLSEHIENAAACF